jgi:hypothetical protein
MDDPTKVLPEDITDVNMFAAILNKQFAKYNELFTKTMTKEQIERIQAELVLENKEILKNIKVEGQLVDELKGKLIDLTDTIKIQGEFIAKMKTYVTPENQKKTFAGEMETILKSETFQKLVKNDINQARFEINTKDVAFGGTYGSGAAGQAYMPFQVPQLPPAENFDVRLILPTGMSDSTSLQYPMERAASLTNNIGSKTENEAGGESTFGFTMGTATATRITTFVEVSRTALRNSAWLSGYISNRLMQMFVANLNTQCIAGAGSGSDLTGLVENANTFAGTNFANKIANANYFDVLNCAKGEMNGLYKIVPNTYLINPYDGTILTSSKNTISDFVAPATFLQPNAAGYTGAFGMRQIESADITADTYLVAAIAPQFMQLLFNGAIEILASDSHASNFISDLVAIKIQAQVLLPIYNANALMGGTLSTDLETIKAV